MNKILFLGWVGLGMAIAFGAEASDRNCAKAVVTRQGPCDELRVSFDVSECDFESSDAEIPAKVTRCSEDLAIVEATVEGHQIRGKLSGKVWAGREAWEAMGRAEVTKPKKEKKKKEEPVQAKAEPTPLPSVFPPSVPVPTSVVAPFAPTHSWYGDLRYRTEKVGQESITPTNYIQNRIRARIGVKAQIAEDTGLDFRLATGLGRASTNQTLGSATNGMGGGLSNYTIGLDRAAFKWSAIAGPVWTLNANGGRTQNPFYTAGGNDLIYDADLNFDGVNVVQEWKTGGAVTPFLVGAYTWLTKITNSNQEDTAFSSLNAGVKVKAGEAKYMLTGQYHYFKNISSTTPIDTTTGNTLAGGKYATGFKLVTVGGEAVFPVFGEQPLTLYVDYVKNLAADVKNTGYIVGGKIGKFDNPGDIQACYSFRKLEADSAVASLVDGDNMNGGTDGFSHQVCLSYKVRKSWHIGATYYFGKKYIASDETRQNRNRGQLDMVFYF